MYNLFVPCKNQLEQKSKYQVGLMKSKHKSAKNKKINKKTNEK